MFLIFSNKFGCLGSVLLSGVLTIIVLVLLGVVNIGAS